MVTSSVVGLAGLSMTTSLRSVEVGCAEVEGREEREVVFVQGRFISSLGLEQDSSFHFVCM